MHSGSNILTVIIPLNEDQARIDNVLNILKLKYSEQINFVLVLDDFKNELFQTLNEVVKLKSHIEICRGSWKNPGSARNAGISRVKTEWVAFWDSDDEPNINSFLQMVIEAKSQGSDAVLGGFEIKDARNLKPKRTIYCSNNKYENFYAFPGLWRCAFRFELIKDLRFLTCSMGEDQEYLFSALTKTMALTVFREAVYTYIESNVGSLTMNKKNMSDLIYPLLILASKEEHPDPELETLRKVFMSRILFSVIKHGTLPTKISALRKVCRHTLRKNLYFPKDILCGLAAAYKYTASKNPSAAPNDYLYLTGGLGNQLFQYAFAISSDETRVLKIDCVLGGPVRENEGKYPALFEYLLNQNVHALSGKSPNFVERKIGFFGIKLSASRDNCKNRIIRRISYLPLAIFHSHYVGKRVKVQLSRGIGYSELDLAKKNRYIIGYFQSFKWASLPKTRKELFDLELRNPSVELTRYKNLAKEEQPIVVHIRLGDYLNESEFGILPTSYYEQALQSLAKTQMYKSIWVFTNDEAMAKTIMPRNLKLPIRWIPNVEDSAAVTLEVMRLGSAYIIGNSTFSWWGAFLSRNSEAKVIAPSPWFRSGQEPVQLCPPEWERIRVW